jgi:hypothetical protein
MEHVWNWFNQNAGAVQALTAVVVAALTIVLALMAVRSDRKADRALRFTKDQFDREWNLGLYLRIEYAPLPPVSMQVINLGKAAAMVHSIHLRRQSHQESERKFPISVVILQGGTTTVNLQEPLNEYVWKNVTRISSRPNADGWSEQRVSLEFALGAYSAGRDTTTEWVLFEAILKVHKTHGSRVDRVERTVATKLRNVDDSA